MTINNSIIRRIINFPTDFLLAITVVCAVLMLLLVSAHVVGRYLWQPIPVTYVIVSYWLMMAFIFLSIAQVQRNRTHITITGFTEWLPPYWRTVLTTFGYVVMFAVFLIYGWYAWLFAMDAFHVRQYTEDIINITTWPVAFYIPIGAWTLSLQTLITIIENIRTLKQMRAQCP